MLRRAVCSALACLGLLAVLATTATPSDALTPNERTSWVNTLTALRGNNVPAAYAAAAADPLVTKYVKWWDYSHPGSGARFEDIVAFIDANPDWPSQAALRQRAEDAIAGVSDDVLQRWFARNRPLSGGAKLRDADILLAQHQTTTAQSLIRDAWITGDYQPPEERMVIDRYGATFGPADDWARMDRLLWDNRTDAAQRMMSRVTPDQQLLADARLKLAAESRDADRAVDRVPASLQNDPGLLYQRLRWERLKGQDATVLALLLHPIPDLGRPNLWWSERSAVARKVLEKGDARTAYTLVSRHGMTDGGAGFADAEFLSGWIALRFLHDPQRAYLHFIRLYEGTHYPLSISRGAYWAGRAAEEMKQSLISVSWFTNAAAYPTTYYGQLAAAKLNRDLPMQIASLSQIDATTAGAYERRDTVQVVRALAELGENDRAKPFLQRLSDVAASPADHALLSTLLSQIGRAEISVGIARRVGYSGVTMLDAGYPLMAPTSPATASGAPGPELPLVLAVTRQESAFDREAISRSGARGLMQLMPATASDVARQLSLPFSADMLTADGSYNLTLGQAYLDQMLSRFNGSYILAIAAYNAGPGRVNQWLAEFGDPRAAGADAIDWVESIPISETRNYVQRVLENVQVYRLRLNQPPTLSLAADLRR